MNYLAAIDKDDGKVRTRVWASDDTKMDDDNADFIDHTDFCNVSEFKTLSGGHGFIVGNGANQYQVQYIIMPGRILPHEGDWNHYLHITAGE